MTLLLRFSFQQGRETMAQKKVDTIGSKRRNTCPFADGKVSVYKVCVNIFRNIWKFLKYIYIS